MSRGVGRARNCTRHTSAGASARSDAFTDSVLPRPASPCTHIIAFAADDVGEVVLQPSSAPRWPRRSPRPARGSDRPARRCLPRSLTGCSLTPSRGRRLLLDPHSRASSGSGAAAGRAACVAVPSSPGGGTPTQRRNPVPAAAAAATGDVAQVGAQSLLVGVGQLGRGLLGRDRASNGCGGAAVVVAA